MVMLLTDGLCTKSYDQFIERFSNPGHVPDETARNARISRFAMRFSPTCWYEATASLYENAQPWILIEGGGDDCGVVISVRVPDDARRQLLQPRHPVIGGVGIPGMGGMGGVPGITAIEDETI